MNKIIRKYKKKSDNKNWIYYGWKWYGLPTDDKTNCMSKYEIQSRNNYQKFINDIRKNKALMLENE